MEEYIRTIVNQPEYFGIKRLCNICGFRFARFAPFGQTSREAQCPVCGSLERHRHFYIHLLPLLPFLKGKRILHFAPEQIVKKIIMDSGAEYFDADIVQGRASHQVDITNINFESMFFDYCVAIHVLEHIDDDVKAFAELYRVLKPGGMAFLDSPTRKEAFEDNSIVSEEDRLKSFGQKDHVRWYSQDLFEERIIAAGFNIQRSEPIFFPKEMREACLLGDKIVLAKK